MRVAGSYFRNSYRPLSLGALDSSGLTLADQALIAIVSPQPNVLYTEWGTQDGGGSWSDSTPAANYQAYAVSDYQLVAVANTTQSEVTTLAVLSPFLTAPDAVAAAFNGTPFRYEKTEGVYADLDSNIPPSVLFLYWLTLRDGTDPKTGPTSLVYASTLVGGVLSYILSVPLTTSTRARPSASINAALQQQAGSSPISIPSTPAQQSTTPSPSASPGVPVLAPLPSPSSAPAAPAKAASSQLNLFYVGLGTLAGYLGYQWWKGRKA